MKIAIVSKANAPGGGASRVAEDHAGWFIEAGHEVTHFCGTIYGDPLPCQRSLHPTDARGKLTRLIHRTTHQLGLNEALPAEYVLGWRSLLRGFDIIHFHDHYRSYSALSLPLMAGPAKVFFTAHDCLHFTGGCVYPMGCTAYLTHCGQCPQRAWIGRYDFTRFNQSLHRRVAAGSDVTYIYPSRWLFGEAQKTLQHGCPPVLLPNGFDPQPYNIVPRAEARRRLGYAPERKIVCISAHYLADVRKGATFALQAVNAVRDLNPLVILVGNPADDLDRHLAGLEYQTTGYIASRERLGLIYAAADAFLFCPLQDNLPISVQESMAAATPVVGFATGGIPDMIEHGVHAWLAPTGDQRALNAYLRDALVSGQAAARGLAARAAVLARYSKAECVAAHEQLYRAA